MDKVPTVGVTEECSLDNTLMIERVALVYTFGLMEEPTMENGFKVNSMVKAFT